MVYSAPVWAPPSPEQLRQLAKLIDALSHDAPDLTQRGNESQKRVHQARQIVETATQDTDGYCVRAGCS
jgi:hypothetical protein